MRASSILWFLRPTFGVILCYVVAVVAAYFISNRGTNELEQQVSLVAEFTDDLRGLQKPSPELDPQAVVEIQVAAMRDRDTKRGAVQCMMFASPDNLKITGPLPKFARMLRDDRFSVLTEAPSPIVGAPIFLANNARVLVTASSEEQGIQAFVWVLARQTSGDAQDCWMTEGVFPLASRLEQQTEEI